MKKAIFVLLIAVVAASGCTTDDIATEQDLQDQTSELKQHTSQALEKDNNLVREIWLKDVGLYTQCVNESVPEEQRSMDDYYLISPDLFERDSGIQEFQGGTYLVRNGFDLSDVDVPYCDGEISSVSLDSVKYNKTVYQNGAVVSTASERCSIWEDFRGGLSRYEIEEQLVEEGKEIYTECLGVPVDSWQPVGGENR